MRIEGEAPSIRWLGLLAVVGVLICQVVLVPAGAGGSGSDEATQMCGLGLDPAAMVRWLAGTESHQFGQYPDRMPPASYWLGWAWARAFGARRGVAAVAGPGVRRDGRDADL